MFIPCGWLIPLSPQEIHGSKSESSPFPLFQFETFTFLTQLKFETTIFSPLSAEKKVVLIANYKVSLLQESSHQWINPFMHRDDYFKMSFLILPKKCLGRTSMVWTGKVSSKFHQKVAAQSLDGKLHWCPLLVAFISCFKGYCYKAF